ncbi:SEC-C metal-binding domain-containing protein [Megalodesulfovibrio paquesii]
MKVGRNDPCPCGSGKKYKKCCLAALQEAENTPYRRISDTYNALADKLMQFTERELGMDIMDLALDAFFLEALDQSGREPFQGFSQLFVPWALFTWIPTPDALQTLEPPYPPDLTIAEVFLQRKGRSLDARERQILAAVGRRPFTFCEIFAVQPGEGFRCQDLFTDAERSVTEQSASRQLQQGDILFCSITAMEGFEMLIGISPVLFPASFKPRVLELRGTLPFGGGGAKADAVLLQGDREIRALYLAMHADLHRLPGRGA